MADTLKDDLLPLVDDLRGLAGELGFRPFQTFVRVVTWSGGKVGVGARSIDDTQLLVGNRQDVKVRAVRREDIVAGNNAQVEAQYDIGPLTPSYPGGGVPYETINPPFVPGCETFFVIRGDGFPESGLLCKRIHDSTDRALRRTVRVESLGKPA